MGRTLVYPKKEKNTVHRKNNRGKLKVLYGDWVIKASLLTCHNHPAAYDLHTIHSIINSTPVLHVSFNSLDPEDPFPVILPMMYVETLLEKSHM